MNIIKKPSGALCYHSCAECTSLVMRVSQLDRRVGSGELRYHSTLLALVNNIVPLYLWIIGVFCDLVVIGCRSALSRIFPSLERLHPFAFHNILIVPWIFFLLMLASSRLSILFWMIVAWFCSVSRSIHQTLSVDCSYVRFCVIMLKNNIAIRVYWGFTILWYNSQSWVRWCVWVLFCRIRHLCFNALWYRCDSWVRWWGFRFLAKNNHCSVPSNRLLI